MTENLYLLYIRQPKAVPDKLDLLGNGTALAPGVFLVRSTLGRSTFYHRIKWQLPADTGLLVAPLADKPKFKGMEPGALKWLRDS